MDEAIAEYERLVIAYGEPGYDRVIIPKVPLMKERTSY
jgi:predicted ATPase